MFKKADPPSIDDLLRKKREADEATAKPRFISKRERERLALEEKQKEVEARAKALEKREKELEAFKKAVEYPAPSGPRSTNGVPRGPRNGNGTNGHEYNSRPAQSGSARSEPTVSNDNKRKPDEATLVRERYMGPDLSGSKFSAAKKRKRTTDKRFNFGWDNEEDTSVDDAIYKPANLSQEAVNMLKFLRESHEREQMGKKHDRDYYAREEAYQERVRHYMEHMRQQKEHAPPPPPPQPKKSWAELPASKHWSEKRLEDMRERDWRIFKEDFHISTKGGAIPNPMRNWGESGLPPRLLQLVEDVGYVEPSAVQKACIPIALQNRDLIGIAVTGSGKTAAFLLPLLVYISRMDPLSEINRQDGPYAIILAPTRELAQQIELEAKKFATPLGFKCVSIVGGHSIEEQSYQLRDGAEIVIATPGRLVDCIERRILVLSQCCYVIMDEADRMIDLGFEEPVNKILDSLPVTNQKPDSEDAEDTRAMSVQIGGGLRYRQTMMYTATMPTAVERIARKYLARPAIVTIGNVGEAVETVEQRVEFVSGEDKRKKRLAEILKSGEFAPPIIVFVNIKRNCDAIARDIKHMGFSSVTLHGSKTQEQREAALLSVREGKTEVLVATDLAGRGIDVSDVSLVVNFNMAGSIEQYTHRIGRTGRAGKSGIAITFLGQEDVDVMYDLKQMLSKSSLSRVPEELRRHEAAQSKRPRGGHSGGGDKGGDGGGGGGGGGGRGGW